MSTSASSVQVDLDYVKSPPGVLKIVEFFLLMIAFSSLASTGLSHSSNSRYHFFLFVTVTLWLVVIGLFIFFLLKLHERVNAPWVILMMVFNCVACMGLLIASSLIADDASDLHKSSVLTNKYIIVDFCDYSLYTPYCRKYDAAAAFGFFSLIAFALDCAFYVWKFMRNRNESGGQPAGERKIPAEPGLEGLP